MNFNQHYIVLMKYFHAVLPIFSIKIPETSTYTICARSQQTSTNSSLSANLGCDDDMETFSLTNDGVNQFWSLELDNNYTVDWIILSVDAGTYSIYVELIGSPPVKCMDIRQSEDKKLTQFQQLITCKYPNAAYRKGNRISIIRTQSGRTKVFELKPIGLSGINRSVQLNFTESSSGLSKALDNDMDTFYQSPEQVQASWFLKLDRNYVIKWILISTRGVCPAGRYGPNCAKCRKECVSCSPISGVCNQCHGPFYGDFCKYQCPTTCLNAKCDQTSGTCESCIEGYYGTYCDPEITTATILKGT
ncbi:cysteine-rich with EGF-like domain protein 2-A [Ostrea edulis]|uniref:cysteine-rich with EGF-like domain protein 2-A n=1 Tax=Ostrea edulis TaxID=37623 RepID=UPI0024AF43F7|nr:cysteine-rich with EGF-like domain protein 2-A [Ostrea edulis]